MNINQFDFFLPKDLIAQFPPKIRGNSKLLIYQPPEIKDDFFSNIVEYFQKNDVLVINNTKVIKARIFGYKKTGGKVEVLIERVIHEKEAFCLIKSSNTPKIGTNIQFSDTIEANVIGREDDLFILRFNTSLTVWEILEKIGKLPLPPYIERAADSQDENRYQTIYATERGAVAAPTAGLHFTEEILKKLSNKGVQLVELTLHVGAGTFQPVRVHNIEEHRMHKEWYSIPLHTQQIINKAKAKGYRICAIGTTTLRALESSACNNKIITITGDTDIFIKPGYHFQIVDRLITNFHLPKSTLLMLVSAFSGIEEIRSIYHHAIRQHYRFFSYGDCMLLSRK